MKVRTEGLPAAAVLATSTAFIFVAAAAPLIEFGFPDVFVGVIAVALAGAWASAFMFYLTPDRPETADTEGVNSR